MRGVAAWSAFLGGVRVVSLSVRLAEALSGRWGSALPLASLGGGSGALVGARLVS